MQSDYNIVFAENLRHNTPFLDWVHIHFPSFLFLAQLCCNTEYLLLSYDSE